MAVERKTKVNFIRGAAALGVLAGVGLTLLGSHMSMPTGYEMAHHIAHPVDGLPLALMGTGVTLTVGSAAAFLWVGRILE